jgi:hypothetical protein
MGHLRVPESLQAIRPLPLLLLLLLLLPLQL